MSLSADDRSLDPTLLTTREEEESGGSLVYMACKRGEGEGVGWVLTQQEVRSKFRAHRTHHCRPASGRDREGWRVEGGREGWKGRVERRAGIDARIRPARSASTYVWMADNKR